MKIVILNGQPRCGKDTFVELCQDVRKNLVAHISTVTYVKELATKLGWKGEKTPEARKFLSDLKDILTEFDDIPFKKVEQFCRDKYLEWEQYGVQDFGIIFVDCREPEEIQKFVDRLGAQSLLIRRPSIETPNQSNHADAMVFDYNYDCVLFNELTLDDFAQSAITYMNLLDCQGPEKQINL